MPRLTSATPKYRLHRPSGQAVVTLSGKDFYLGPHGTQASHLEYDRRIAEWLAAGRQLPQGPVPSDLSVTEMLAAYKRYCKDYYRRPDGTVTDEVGNLDLAMRPLRQLYGNNNAADFGPLKLKTVRDAMVAQDLCRTEINKRMCRIVRAFRWAVENELVPPSIYHGLKSVAALRRGRCGVRESERVRPVADEHIDAIKPFVLPPVWAMIQLQRLTGMRPGEVVQLRAADLDRSRAVWVYTPREHKTAYHGHGRRIFLGPRAQAVLEPWLQEDQEAYLFSPAKAVQRHNETRRQNRRTPRTPSQNKRRPRRNPRRAAGDRYDRCSYARAIARACRRADQLAHRQQPEVPAEQVLVPHWHPHQLRHSSGTQLRRDFGLDVARVVLGQRSAAVTEIYAEIDFDKGMDVMQRVG